MIADLERSAAGGSEAAVEVDNVMAELATLQDTFSNADPMLLNTALRKMIEDITLYWGPGGARKWRLERGVIRFREPWRVALVRGEIRELFQIELTLRGLNKTSGKAG